MNRYTRILAEYNHDLRRVLAEQERERQMLASGNFRKVRNPETGEDEIQRIPKQLLPECGARCRDGHACRARVVFGKARCRMHGGVSTGPRTAAGKARIAESNRRRAAMIRTP